MSLIYVRNSFEGEPTSPDRIPYRPKGYDFPIDPQGFALGQVISDQQDTVGLDPFFDNLSNSGFVVQTTEIQINPEEDVYWKKAFERNPCFITTPIRQIATLSLGQFSESSRGELFAVLTSIGRVHNISLFDVNYTSLSS